MYGTRIIAYRATNDLPMISDDSFTYDRNINKLFSGSTVEYNILNKANKTDDVVEAVLMVEAVYGEIQQRKFIFEDHDKLINNK